MSQEVANAPAHNSRRSLGREVSLLNRVTGVAMAQFYLVGVFVTVWEIGAPKPVVPKEVSLHQSFLGFLPFIGLQILGIILVLTLQQIALLLPSL